MNLKLLQLNIYQGKQYKILKDYLKNENFDILALQELSGGQKGYVKTDIFKDLKSYLDLDGDMVKDTNFIGDPKSYIGNGILFKKNLEVSNRQEIWMKPFRETSKNNKDWPTHPHAGLSLDFNIGGRIYTVVNVHMVWGPTPFDEDYKAKQAKILLNYMKSLKNPFIFTGDFNLVRETKIMESFAMIGQDLAYQKGITNTLNPRIHRAKGLFPKGLSVDYVFVSKEIAVKDFKLIDTPDLSDHFGLSLTFQV